MGRLATLTAARPRSVGVLPPPVLLLGSIASVQFGAGVAVRLFDRIGPGGAVLMRLGLSAVLAFAIARPRLRGRSRRDLGVAALFGLILGGMNWSFYEALQRLPLGVAVTIEFLGPLALAIAGSRRLLDGLWVLLAAGGVAMLALPGDTDGITTAGIVLALVAAVGWASYILVSKQIGQVFGAFDGLAISLAVATLVVLPIGLHDGGRALLQPGVLMAGLVVALLSSLIPYSLEILALRSLSAATFGLLMSVEPAFGALAGALVLGQRLTLLTTGAIALVVVASVGTTITAHRRARPIAAATAVP